MSQQQKKPRYTRSREDHDLFKLVLPSFSPELVEDILIHLAPGRYLRPEEPFATVFYRNSSSLFESQDAQNGGDRQGHPLTINIGGTVEKLGEAFVPNGDQWHLREAAKRGSLELLWLRQCQHLLQNQSMENGNIQANFNLPAGEICPRCGKQIWLYTSALETAVTAEELLRFNSHVPHSALKQIEWSVIINEQFTPTTAIAQAAGQELNYPMLAKPTYLLGEGEKPLMGRVVMKIRRVYCCHQRVVDKRCQFCFQIIEEKDMREYNRYLFQLGSSSSTSSLTKGAALAHQEEEYIASLLSKNKVILILDLDNTILHSNQMSELDQSTVLKLEEFFLLPKIERNSEGKILHDFIVVKMRPYLKEFLYVVSKHFEIYVYTKGTREYADMICRWVRAQWAGEPPPNELNTWPEPPLEFLKDTDSFLPNTVISRNEDSNIESKSMENILPNRHQYHIILDDRRQVWKNAPSWFYTRDYYYFSRKNPATTGMQTNGDSKMAEQPQLIQSEQRERLLDCYKRMREDYPLKKESDIQVVNRPDSFLLFVAHTFKKMHSYFFEHLKKNKEEKQDPQLRKDKPQPKPHSVSLTNIMQRLKYFFSKKKLRFFLAPEDQGITAISTVRRALKMGAIVLKENCSDSPDFVIRGNSYIKFVKNHQVDLRFPVEEISLEDNQQVPNHITGPVTTSTKDYSSELSQLKIYAEKGIPVISETWISACYEYSYKFRPDQFRLSDPLKQEVNPSDFNEVISKNAERIRKEICEQMSKDEEALVIERLKQQGKDKISGQDKNEDVDINRLGSPTSPHLKKEQKIWDALF